MKKFSEKELNMICSEIREELQTEHDCSSNSLYMNYVNATLDTLQRFVLKIQKHNKAGE